jgi:ketosteroid isomerase-like protein
LSVRSEVTAVIQALVKAVNEGDFGDAVSAFTDDAVIVEDIPPYRWTGSDAPARWLSAMGANAAHLGVTSVRMRIGQPTRLEADDTHAYTVVPGELALSMSDADLSADGVLVVTLQSRSGRWLIDSLTWGGGAAR